jgi:hypothetical protein
LLTQTCKIIGIAVNPNGGGPRCGGSGPGPTCTNEKLKEKSLGTLRLFTAKLVYAGQATLGLNIA